MAASSSNAPIASTSSDVGPLAGTSGVTDDKVETKPLKPVGGIRYVLGKDPYQVGPADPNNPYLHGTLNPDNPDQTEWLYAVPVGTKAIKAGGAVQLINLTFFPDESFEDEMGRDVLGIPPLPILFGDKPISNDPAKIKEAWLEWDAPVDQPIRFSEWSNDTVQLAMKFYNWNYQHGSEKDAKCPDITAASTQEKINLLQFTKWLEDIPDKKALAEAQAGSSPSTSGPSTSGTA